MSVSTNYSLMRKDQITIDNKKEFKKSSTISDRTPLPLHIEEIKAKLEFLNLDSSDALEYGQDYEFLFHSRLIYAIIGLQNTTTAGKVDHAIHHTDTGLMIKKQGTWVSVKSLRDDFVWDENEKRLATKGCPFERWSYADEGLLPIDHCYHHDEAEKNINYPASNACLTPVTKLSKGEMEQLLLHANKFDGFKAGFNPERKRFDSVVQFVSDPDPLTEEGLLQNFKAQQPVHVSVRLILSDGTVYSTGLGKTSKENEFGAPWYRSAASVNGQPTHIDYTEFKPHQGRIVTSVPLDSQQAELILKKINQYRKGSIRFNIYKQNCVYLAERVLQWSGVKCNTKVAMFTLFYRFLPSCAVLKGIRKRLKPLSSVVTVIKANTPAVVNKIIGFVADFALYLPRKSITLISNIILLAVGGGAGTPNHSKSQEPNDDFSTFQTLISNPFSEESLYGHHSGVFINWQLNQKSSFIHQYPGQPNMSIIPSASTEALEYSNNQGQQFWKLYRHSIG